MSDTRSMVYYLLASAQAAQIHPLAVSSKALTTPQVKSEVSIFTNFLCSTEYSVLHVGPSISSPTGGALNVVVRSLNWQTHRNYRGARRAHRSRSWNSRLRSRRSELCGIWSRGRFNASHRHGARGHSIHRTHQLCHHRPSGNRL